MQYDDNEYGRNHFLVPMSNNNFNPMDRINPAILTKLLLIWVPPQQPQVHRPFVPASVDNEIVTQFDKATHGGQKLFANQLCQFSSSIMRPSDSHMGLVNISHGFEEQRYAFVAEFTVKLGGVSDGIEAVEVITGYTTHDGYDGGVASKQFNSSSVNIAPDLRFFVNDRMEFTRQITHGNYSQQLMQVQAPEFLFHSHGVNNSELSLMTPENIIQNQERRYNENNNQDHMVLDLRSSIHAAPLGNQKYNAASHYLSDVLRSFVEAKSPYGNESRLDHGFQDYGHRMRGTIENMVYKGASVGKNANSSRYYGAMSNNPHKATNFTYQDITNAWGANYVEGITNVTRPSSTAYVLNPLEESCHFQGSDLVTSVVCEITHALPYVMLLKAVAIATVTITDRTPGNEILVNITNISEISQGSLTSQDIYWMMGEITRNIGIGILKSRLGGNFDVFIDFNMATNMMIRISLDGGNPYPYSPPMFCSSIYSPQIAVGEQMVDNLSETFMDLFDMIDSNKAPLYPHQQQEPKHIQSGSNVLNFNRKTSSQRKAFGDL